MKVLYIVPHLMRGGSVVVTLRTIKYLMQKKGIVPILFCLDEDKADETLLSEFGFALEDIVVYKSLDLGKRDSELTISSFEEVLKKERPNVVIDTLFDSISLHRVVKMLDIKLVTWLHGMPFALTSVHISKWELKARESFVNTLIYHTIAPMRARMFKENDTEQYKEILVSSDLFFVLCQGYKDELVKEIGLSRENADKIFPMINTIEPVEHVDLDRKEKKIVSIGRLDLLHKRHDRFVEVWKYAHERLPDWSLDIYGWSPNEGDTAQLEEWIREIGAPRIRFCGISRNPSDVYASASVSILTSASEGWPVALMEAQRQGVVPIASNCCRGVEEVIRGTNGNQEAGILVSEPFNARRFADQLVALCQNDELLRRLQRNCLDRISGYQPEVNEASWQAFFNLLGV